MLISSETIIYWVCEIYISKFSLSSAETRKCSKKMYIINRTVFVLYVYCSQQSLPHNIVQWITTTMLVWIYKFHVYFYKPNTRTTSIKVYIQVPNPYERSTTLTHSYNFNCNHTSPYTNSLNQAQSTNHSDIPKSSHRIRNKLLY